MQKGVWVLCVAQLMVTGCSRDEPAEDPAKVSATRGENGSRVTDDNVFSDQVKALEKAEAIEKTMSDAVAKQRDAIEKQQ